MSFCCLRTNIYPSLLRDTHATHNKTIIEFGYRIISRIIKPSVCVIRLSLLLWQITQTLVLIIFDIMLKLAQ